jgi:hypothetical protein
MKIAGAFAVILGATPAGCQAEARPGDSLCNINLVFMFYLCPL